MRQTFKIVDIDLRAIENNKGSSIKSSGILVGEGFFSFILLLSIHVDLKLKLVARVRHVSLDESRGPRFPAKSAKAGITRCEPL